MQELIEWHAFKPVWYKRVWDYFFPIKHIEMVAVEGELQYGKNIPEIDFDIRKIEIYGMKILKRNTNE